MAEYSPEIWFQISAKYRTVACFPKHVNTPYEAYLWAMLKSSRKKTLSKNAQESVYRWDWRSVGNQYLRCYASNLNMTAELTTGEWNEFKQNGGGTFENNHNVNLGDENGN